MTSSPKTTATFPVYGSYIPPGTTATVSGSTLKLSQATTTASPGTSGTNGVLTTGSSGTTTFTATNLSAGVAGGTIAITGRGTYPIKSWNSSTSLTLTGSIAHGTHLTYTTFAPVVLGGVNVTGSWSGSTNTLTISPAPAVWGGASFGVSGPNIPTGATGPIIGNTVTLNSPYVTSGGSGGRSEERR